MSMPVLAGYSVAVFAIVLAAALGIEAHAERRRYRGRHRVGRRR